MAEQELGRGMGSAWGPAQDGHSGSDHWKGLPSTLSLYPESAGVGRGTECPGDQQ